MSKPDPIWASVNTAVTSISNLFALDKQRKLAIEEQKLATQREQEALAQAEVEKQKASGLSAQAQSLTDQFYAKMKMVKAYAVPLSIAASVAIVALTYYYIKKNKK